MDVNKIMESAARQKILGKNLLVKKVVEFIISREVRDVRPLLLCAASGLVLSAFHMEREGDITGFRIDFKKVQASGNDILGIDFFYDYTLFLEKETDEGARKTISDALSTAETILEMFAENEAEAAKLLLNLDCVNNAIMMCDRGGNITFANSTFCNNFAIGRRDDAIGANIAEIMEQNGIQITAVETESRQLKMMEVLKTGKPCLDWPVRMESKHDDNVFNLISNDMFPTFDEKHRVSGLIEISRTQRQEVKKTRKYVGLNAEYDFNDVIGNSNIICKKIGLAKSFAGNRGTVLITGESGVGKEIFAQAIHNHSMRSKGPFVALNCANFPAELIESELFGYVEGAFTGASKKGQMGKFELANGGTLFLDEIGELPYYFQSKLLRVLETWTITKVGGLKEIPVDVRLIAATNRNLPKMIEQGLFRQDLYYRLQVLTLDIPPLRERIEDVPLIAEHFLNIFAKQNGHDSKQLSDSAKLRLMSYPWPGNARELKNVMNRIDLLCRDEIITGETIDSSLNSEESFDEAKTDSTPEERISLRKKEIDVAYMNLLSEALDITGGNKKNAAELLGISRKTMYRMLEKYNMK